MYFQIPNCPGCGNRCDHLGSVSIDAFCSMECRKRVYLDRGCSYCGTPYDDKNSQSWRIGTMLDYTDIEAACGKCIIELPKYNRYVEKIEQYNNKIDNLIQLNIDMKTSLLLVRVGGRCLGVLDENTYSIDINEYESISLEDAKHLIAYLEVCKDKVLQAKMCQNEITILSAKSLQYTSYKKWLQTKEK